RDLHRTCDVRADELIERSVVQCAEHLVGVAAGLIEAVRPHHAGVVQQEIDWYALQLRTKRLNLLFIHYVQPFNPDSWVLCRKVHERRRCGVATMSGNYRPSASRVLPGELQTNALACTCDQHPCLHDSDLRTTARLSGNPICLPHAQGYSEATLRRLEFMI